MDDSLWGRIPPEMQAEVDRLVSIGHNVQAIAAMREHAGLPQPSLPECVDLLDQRFTALRSDSR
ncbi:hypothetical protein Scani_18520 [Streptomyces caniferus]|uniref:Uncharacterized protein n=1 Tax=Streptomyces caniferus TaxID=285557 RepID=A0A640S410_9ACTN|nr:hypothetical protein Scani_18520 [Streptomyces caniferus]